MRGSHFGPQRLMPKPHQDLRSIGFALLGYIRSYGCNGWLVAAICRDQPNSPRRRALHLVRRHLPLPPDTVDRFAGHLVELLRQRQQALAQPSHIILHCKAPNILWPHAAFRLPLRPQRRLPEHLPPMISAALPTIAWIRIAFAKAITAMSMSTKSAIVGEWVSSTRPRRIASSMPVRGKSISRSAPRWSIKDRPDW
jgi:hypothetical protein